MYVTGYGIEQMCAVARRRQKRAMNPLTLKLEAMWAFNVSAGNQAGPLQEQYTVSTAKPSLQSPLSKRHFILTWICSRLRWSFSSCELQYHRRYNDPFAYP